MNKISIYDETISRKEINSIELEFKNTEVTLKEIIEERVKIEVKNQNLKEEKPYFGLVTPTLDEFVLNATNKKGKRRTYDPEEQIYIALDGFMKNKFFVVINNEQIDNLETIINVEKINAISFIKLTPLIGG